MPPVIGFKLVVTDPSTIIEKRLKTSIVDTVNIAAKIAVRRLPARIAPLIRQSIMNAPETQALLGNDLRGELGVLVSEVQAWLDYVINSLISTMRIDFIPMKVYGGGFKGYIRVSVMPSYFIDDASKHATGKFLASNGQEIPWAEWLLTFGDKIIIRDYFVDFSRHRGSRTGLASMTPQRGRSWRVPAQYSGTRTNNMITRALEDNLDFITYFLEDEFVKAL